MLALSFQGQVTTGDDAFDLGISDLVITNGPNGPVLVAVSRMDGGFASYSLSEDNAPTLETIRAFEADLHAGNGPSLVALDEGVLAAGLDSGEIVSFDISSSHSLTNQDIDSLGTGDWTHVTAISDTRIAVAAEDSNTMSVYDLNGSGDWDLVRSRSDGSATFLRDLGALASTTVNGKDFVLTASTSENGITAYEITTTNIFGRDNIDASDGVGMMIPTDIDTVTVGGTTFVLVANAPSSGASGAITVMELSGTGSLTPTDHVMDTRDSRFGMIQSLSAIEHDGVGLVAVGGGDDGLSLLALLDDGRLVHLGALPNSLDGGLDGVTEIETAIIGDTLHIYVTSGGDYGISTFTADLSDYGTTKIAAASGGGLSGTNDDDILVDGAGVDTIYGGNGDDIFVLTSDGNSDWVSGFNVSHDTLDLSSWTQLYDAASLAITSTSNGARIEWRDEVLTLTASNGQSIDPDDLRAAIDLDINRSFYAPELSLVGSSGADSLTGSWGIDSITGNGGDDALYGESGDDVISGGNGDDMLDGGAGDDTALLDYAVQDLVFVATDSVSITVGTDQETDWFSSIETFVFSDQTLTSAELSGLFEPASVVGTAGDDDLSVTHKAAYIDGAGGNDRLTSGNFDDTLLGGAGNDTLAAGGGNDTIMGDGGTDRAVFDYATTDLTQITLSGTDVTLIGATGTDVLLSVEEFEFSNMMVLRDDLFDLIATETLTGGSGNDTLTITDAPAHLIGQGGNDNLTAGAGDDTLSGGSGDDTLLGGSGNDSIESGLGDDSIDGGDGTDLLTLSYSSDDLIDVESSGSTLILTTSSEVDSITGVETFILSDGTFTTNDLSALFETITLDGTTGDDVLTAGSDPTALFGYAGHDSLTGGYGNDYLDGGDGNDVLKGFQGDDNIDAGTGNDDIYAHSGDDTLYGGDGDDELRGGPDQDQIFGGDGADALRGQRHNDTLTGGSGDDNLKGGGGNDFHYGNSGDDFIKGGTYHDHAEGGWGDDTLSGNRGNDTLQGGRGADEMRGGGDNDLLIGGKDADLMFGGTGDDTFVFDEEHGADEIGDFNIADDTLQLSEDLLQGVTDAMEIVSTYASVTAHGVAFDFGAGDTILLRGLNSLTGLDDTFDIV